jgi:hypothetical protein
MRSTLALFLGFLIPMGMLAQGELIRQQLLQVVPKALFDSLLHAQHVPARLAPVRYDVAIYEVDYQTRWHDGSPLMASGLVMLPQNCDVAAPLLAYGHGTRLHRKRVFEMKGEEAICAFYATDGYVVAMPDYLGLGRGERRHLYHHAETEATCMVDILKCAKVIASESKTALSGQLFISGYSQGGHVAMATHKYLQSHPAELGMQVTASAPMSGAYDLAGVQGEVMFKPYEYPGYLPYLLFSYQEVYHLAQDSASYLLPQYYQAIAPLYDGEHRLREISPLMPAIPAEAMNPEMLKAFLQDPAHPMRQAMQKNTLKDWLPQAPVMMCYCKGDEQVSYKNALVTEKAMRNAGASQVKAYKVSRRLRHGPCGLYASMYAKLWFSEIRDGKAAGKPGKAWDRFLLSMSKLFFKQGKPKKKH